jgi:hypothetical protein
MAEWEIENEKKMEKHRMKKKVLLAIFLPGKTLSPLPLRTGEGKPACPALGRDRGR